MLPDPARAHVVPIRGADTPSISKENGLIERGSGNLLKSLQFLVALPEGVHLFPSRTQKLSPPGPMVLHG